jgi:hypothetical protein
MQHLNSLKSAIKGKAPIVALPIEGSAPVCVDRKRLATWSKGVTITSIEVITHHDLEAPRAYDADRYDARRAGLSGMPEGPHQQLPGHRDLVIRGFAGRVKTSCRMVTIDRRTAVKTLAVWSEKERARQLKKTFLGALSKAEKQVMKLAKFDDVEGAGMVPVMVSHLDPKKAKTQAFGVPVVIPELSDFEFILHRSPHSTDEWWSVTERYTGSTAGSGNNPEAALVEARTKASKVTPAGLAKAHAQVDAAKAALASVAA